MNKISNSVYTFLGIMAFYCILAYVLFPVIFYYIGNKSLVSAGHGFVIGSVVNILLWYYYGVKMI